jgi:hypothetical protein
MPLHGPRLAGVQAAVWLKAWQDRRDYAKNALPVSERLNRSEIAP